MAERKATNKYYPPDWDPSKGSVNNHKRSHPLRNRARKIGEGILIVRFEMPFNVWCLGCDNHIGMGVRYNAEKSKVGNYYSSPIYKFRMKCRLCDNYIEIQSDPSKFDYVISSGARKQVRLPESTTSELDQVSNDNDETKRKITDAMFRLEKRIEDKIQSDAQLPGLHELKQYRSRWEDSFAVNQLIRSQFRQRRKRIEQTRAKDKELLKKTCLKIPLVKPSQADAQLAKELLQQSEKVDKKPNNLRQSDLPDSRLSTRSAKIEKSRSLRVLARPKSDHQSNVSSSFNTKIKLEPG